MVQIYNFFLRIRMIIRKNSFFLHTFLCILFFSQLFPALFDS